MLIFMDRLYGMGSGHNGDKAMSFEDYCRRKQQRACAVDLPPYVTLADCTSGVDGLVAVGDEWSRRVFGGPFYRTARPRRPGVPRVNLVFVQSVGGNTAIDDPSAFGGGATDKHLIYEGLSRVDADAVLAGASTARDPELVFSVWRPELVALRTALGRPRHPAQIIVTSSGVLPWNRSLMLQTPELQVFVILPTRRIAEVAPQIADRPWITLVDGGEPLALTRALGALREYGIATISAVGGRRTATALLTAELVTDVYLTTGTREAGAPHTPFYAGEPPRLTSVLRKGGTGVETGVRFEHFVVSG
jgi:riboflavin biosynthesis pyrimidine reductase